MLSVLLAAAIVFPIVDGGQPRAVIAPPAADAPLEIKRAVSELQRVVEKMTHVKLPVGGHEDWPAIHVGRDGFVEKAGLLLDKLDEDGFVIQTIGAHDLVLAGRKPHASEFAVYRFLQKYGGVRWYLPTELGEVVPQADSFSVGKIADRQEPSFKSRLWSSAAKDGGVWERHNLCRGRYSFHHNLLNVFLPSKLYDQHPDWFPEIKGKRFRPKDDHSHNWQPCLANPETAHYAAEAARSYFDANPEASSFSLGMNDTAENGFCECAACKALDPTDPKERKTPRGLPNFSNRFYTFMNRVAAELEKTHPDKYLGCLAYHPTEPPPTFDVNPHIIPYLTAGRANWTDPAIREGDQRLIRGWCKKVPIVGIYDYYYGAGFISPRIFTRLTDESLKFAHKTGVRAFYAEIYSTWSLDGPKAYVASQMLWDVNQNADKLVDDFCRGLFGRASAPMRAYFRYLEQRWMTRPSGSNIMWAGFFDPSQLELWPSSACAKARALLKQAELAADNESDAVRHRVKLYSDGFRQTELWSALYHGEKSLNRVADVQHYLDAQTQLDALDREVIEPNPLHAAPILFKERARNLPGGAVLGALLRMADQPGADAALHQIAAQKSSTDAAAAARAVLTMREHPEQVIETLKNPGFERTEATQADFDSKSAPTGWGVWFRDNTPGELHWNKDAARGGKLGVTLRGAVASCVLQSVPVKSGESYIASAYVRVPSNHRNTRFEAELLIQWRDAAGEWFSAAGRRADRLPAGAGKDWTRLSVFTTVPVGAAQLVFAVSAYNEAAEDALQVDDTSLRRLPQ